MSYYLLANSTYCNTDVVVLYRNKPVFISLNDTESRNRKIIQDLINAETVFLGDFNTEHRTRVEGWNLKFLFRSTGNEGAVHSIVKSDLAYSCAMDWEGRDIAEVIAETLQYRYAIPVTADIVAKVLEYEKPLGDLPSRSLTPLTVYSANPQFAPTGYHIDPEAFKKNMQKIETPLAETQFNWEEIKTTEDYLFRFIGSIKNKLEAGIKVMLDPSNMSPRFSELGIQLYEGQRPIVQAGLEVLKREKFVYLAATMGSGKSLMSLAMNGMHFKGNYRTLVVAPTSTLTHWKKEIERMWGNVEVVIIKKTTDFIDYYNKGFKEKPTYFLVGKETFKLDAPRKPSAIIKKKEVKYSVHDRFAVYTQTEMLDVATCPRCSSSIKNVTKKDLTYLTAESFTKPNKSNYKCSECNEVLWQSYYDKTKKASLIRFIQTKNIMFDSLILDEIHQSNNGASLIGKSVRNLIKYGKKAILLSGTTNNGYASSLHNILLGVKSGMLQEDDCLTTAEFVKKYGTLIAHSSGSDLAKDTDFREVEGINPVLYTKYLARNCVFADLAELRDDLPEILEFYIPVTPADAQLQEQSSLLDQFRQANRFNWKMYENTIVRHYINNPVDWECVPVGDFRICPTSLAGLSLPKEAKLIEIVKQEHSEGRKVCIYTDFTGEATSKYFTGTNIAMRLKTRLEAEGLRVYWLKQSVKAFDRKDVIDRITDDYDVIISNPVLVQVGVNLQAFPTYINYIPSYMVNTVDQSNRRGYRINSVLTNRVYHLYYENTCEDDIIKRYQLKKAESKAIESNFNFSIEDTVKRTASNLSKKLNDVLSE